MAAACVPAGLARLVGNRPASVGAASATTSSSSLCRPATRTSRAAVANGSPSAPLVSRLSAPAHRAIGHRGEYLASGLSPVPGPLLFSALAAPVIALVLSSPTDAATLSDPSGAADGAVGGDWTILAGVSLGALAFAATKVEKRVNAWGRGGRWGYVTRFTGGGLHRVVIPSLMPHRR